MTEIQHLTLRSALSRGDIKQAEQLLLDWKLQKQSWITKWVPGNHFYAQGKKFDHLQDAEAYLKNLGFVSLGLKEVEISHTPVDGD